MLHISSDYLQIIFFIYGLAFFLSGYTILFQSFKLLSAGFAQEIKFLGFFFLLQGLANWGPVLQGELSRILNREALPFIDFIQVLLILFSFYFLLVYSTRLLKPVTNNPWLSYLPNILLFFSVIISIFIAYEYPTDWYAGVKFAIRYIMGFPSTILVVYSLKRRNLSTEVSNTETNNYYMYAIYIAFIILSFSLLISNRAPFFPANIINGQSFSKLFGFRIQFIRTGCSIIIAYSMIFIIDYFHKEFVKKLETSEIENAILEERERISQDIHDGTMQSLFGLGLRIQHIEKLVQKEKYEQSKEYLQDLKEKVDEVSSEIRSYILGLRTVKDTAQFISHLRTFINNFTAESKIHVDLSYYKLVNTKLDPETLTHLTFIISEALNNVRKHAKATSVTINLAVENGYLELNVKDNGDGIKDSSLNTSSIGLKSINKRVESMNGSLELTSSETGTKLFIKIPL